MHGTHWNSVNALLKKKKKKGETQTNANTANIISTQMGTKYSFGKDYFCQIILQFNLFLLLFMGLTALCDTIHGSHYTISVNTYFYLSTFSKKNSILTKKKKQIPKDPK